MITVVPLLFALVLIAAVTVWLVAVPRALPGGPALRAGVAARVAELRPLGAWVEIMLAGVGLTLAVCWPVGRLIARTQHLVDEPVYRWVSRAVATHPDHLVTHWVRVMQLATQMGNKHQVWAVCAVSAVVLAVAYRGAWWVPVLAIAAVIGIEHYLQIALADVVHRGHPPTSLGTYPSGGTARVLCVYGTVVVAGVRIWGGRRAMVVGMGVVTALTAVEGWSRIVLSKHWATDVVGGVLFGALLLAVSVLALTALPRPDRTAAGEADQEAASTTGPAAEGTDTEASDAGLPTPTADAGSGVAG